MDGNDFKIWYQDFAAHFTSVDTWMQRHPDPAAVLRVWKEAMDPLRLVDAKKATAELFADRDAWPESWDQYPATIRWLANKIRGNSRALGTRHVIDGQETFKCHLCFDKGTVDIFHPILVDAIRKNKYNQYRNAGATITAAARCSCEAGQAMKRKLGQYDPILDVRLAEAERAHHHDEDDQIVFEESRLAALERKIAEGSTTNGTDWAPEGSEF